MGKTRSTYMGRIDFKITGKELLNFIKSEVARELSYERQKLQDEIKAIRNLQKRMNTIEMKVASSEVRPKIPKKRR